MQFEMTTVDRSQLPEILRRLDPIEVGPMEIVDAPADPAEKMMMGLQIAVETGLFTGKLQAPDDPQVSERGQSPIDCVQGQGRQAPLKTAMYLFGRGMIVAVNGFPKDFQTLMGQLDSSLFAGFSQKIVLLLTELARHHHFILTPI